MDNRNKSIFQQFSSWYFSREALPFWVVSFLDLLLIFVSMLLMYSLVYGPAKLVANGSVVLYTLMIDLIFYGIGMRIFHTYTDVSKILTFKDLVRTALATLVLLSGYGELLRETWLILFVTMSGRKLNYCLAERLRSIWNGLLICSVIRLLW